MKTMFFMLTALLLAVPAMADVTISCEEYSYGSGFHIVAISYVATEDTNLPRGFGLEVDVDSGVTVTGVSTTNPKYWVYPGDINIVDGIVTEQGSPIASGLGTGSVILEMGSLHYPTGPSGANSPALSDELIRLQLSGGDCNVTVSYNAERGKVVNYEAEEAETVYGSACFIEADECMMATHPFYTNWGLFQNIPCWCYTYQCRGDADGGSEGPFIVSLNDLIILRQWIDFFDPMNPNPVGGACANFDHDKEGPFWVSLNDLIIMRQWIDYFNPMDPIPECNDVHINFWVTP